MVRIAVIDSGVDKNLLDINISHNLVIDSEYHCVKTENSEDSFVHGTVVAMIIKNYYSNMELTSIKVLNEQGRGYVDRLEAAFEWCIFNSIDVVNLSLGTTYYYEQKKLLTIINHYANLGLCIVAATANNGYITFPASFSNVIGVVSRESIAQKNVDYITLGVDVIAQAIHRVTIKDQAIVTSPGNSYATPFVTSFLAKILGESKIKGIRKVKKKLLLEKGNYLCTEAYCPVVDWISLAFFAKNEERSLKEYYFQLAELEEADTIIVYTMEELKKYAHLEKHFVYMGEEKVSQPNCDYFFWSKQNRIRQIEESEKHVLNINTIDIPIIIWEQMGGDELIDILIEIQNVFEENGYHIYGASTNRESIFYYLEYIPEEMITQGKRLYHFICEQINLKQSDAIILVIQNREQIQRVFPEIDLDIRVKVEKGGMHFEIMEDEKEIRNEFIENDKNAVLEISNWMIQYLTEDSGVS